MCGADMFEFLPIVVFFSLARKNQQQTFGEEYKLECGDALLKKSLLHCSYVLPSVDPEEWYIGMGEYPNPVEYCE